MAEGYVVQLFAKAPYRGQVKTRLQALLGDGGCVELHCQLIRHCLRQLNDTSARVELHCSEDHPFFHQLRAPVLCLQQGADLGERMFNASRKGLAAAEAVILVGADCPFVDAGYVNRAIGALQSGADAVIGPAQDGGYVLLGLRRVDSGLFSAMPWGSDQVLPLTRQRLQALQWNWLELPPSVDIDRPEDLELLRDVPGFEWLPI